MIELEAEILWQHDFCFSTIGASDWWSLITHMITTQAEMGRYDSIKLAEKDGVAIIVAVTTTATLAISTSSSEISRQRAAAQEALSAEVERTKQVVCKEDRLNAFVLHCFGVATGGMQNAL
jgi:hypothetical protein